MYEPMSAFEGVRLAEEARASFLASVPEEYQPFLRTVSDYGFVGAGSDGRSFGSDIEMSRDGDAFIIDMSLKHRGLNLVSSTVSKFFGDATVAKDQSVRVRLVDVNDVCISVNEERASWANNLEDGLSDFRTALAEISPELTERVTQRVIENAHAELGRAEEFVSQTRRL